MQIYYSITPTALRPLDFLEWLLRFGGMFKRGEELFLSALSNYFQIPKHKIFLFASAKMGLYTFLKAIHIGKNDEVIVPGYTCVAVTNAVKYTGAKIVYADIDRDDLNISFTEIRKKITSKTKVIIVSHNFGIPFRYIPELRGIYPKIVLIEDSAHSFGSVFQSNKTGLTGDAAFFSFEFSKPITTGMGGAFIINNEAFLGKFRAEYENAGQYPYLWRIKILFTLLVHMVMTVVPVLCGLSGLKRFLMRQMAWLGLTYQSELCEIMGGFPRNYPAKLAPELAYLGYIQMSQIENINDHKKKLARIYAEICDGIDGVTDFYNENCVYVRYPVVLETKSATQKISFVSAGLESGIWFNDVVHPKGCLRYCYTDGTCPNGEDISERIVNLPISINIPIAYLEHNRERIKEILRKAAK